MHILVIEDDIDAAAYMSKGLTESGHLVHHCADGKSGLGQALTSHYDMLIIDRMLPELDGLAIISALRAANISTPVLILSALGEVDDKVQGLKAGGDDYLTKPYAFSELLARLEALARRRQPEQASNTLKLADLEMDLLKHKVKRGGQHIALQPREFRLLEYLMRHIGQVVSRTMLLEQVWDYNFDPQTNVIDVHISRLRNKIDKGFTPPLLHTVRGAGYSLRETP
ncbi:MAG TPA: response regulator transcription factor [Gammaproteobacteria bacterium]|nr:response regulator transcription factor [Gammaproteobacteria bacterium]